jgi:hypothetical protein
MPLFDSSDTRSSGPASIRPKRRLFDLSRLRAADLFDAWVFAETDVALALTAWRSGRSADKADAHAAYLAALDREAHAAAMLQRRLRPAR